MHLTSFATAAALVGAVSARISGVAAPATIAPGKKVVITLVTENYIQRVQDISVAFGLADQVYPGLVGTDLLGSFYLGPSKSNVLGNLTFDVNIPTNITSSAKYLTAVVTSLYGVSNTATAVGFNVPIKVGKQVSRKLNSNYNALNICSQPSNSKRDEQSSPISERGCFPYNTHKLVQDSQVAIGNLINNIFQQSNATGKANYSATIKSLDALKKAVRPASNCNNPAAPTWPPLSPRDSQARAISMLRDAQDVAMNVDQSVIECKKDQAALLFCTARRLVGNIEVYYKS